MKKNKILYCVTMLLLVAVMVSGCEAGGGDRGNDRGGRGGAPRQEKFLTRFDRFANRVYAERNQMTMDEWDDAVVEYEDFMEEYANKYYGRFTPEENQQFGRSQALYTKAVMSLTMDITKEYMDVTTQVMDGYLDEMGSGLDEMGVDDYANDVYENVEHMGNDFEDFSSDLEDEFEKMEFNF